MISDTSALWLSSSGNQWVNFEEWDWMGLSCFNLDRANWVIGLSPLVGSLHRKSHLSSKGYEVAFNDAGIRSTYVGQIALASDVVILKQPSVLIPISVPSSMHNEIADTQPRAIGGEVSLVGKSGNLVGYFSLEPENPSLENEHSKG